MQINSSSTSGYIILVDDMVVVYKSRKQKSVSRSSTESELLAASDSLLDDEFVYRLSEFLISYRVNKRINIISEMYSDNRKMRRILSQGYLSTRTRHVAI
jgi:hypothetical protein